MKFWKKKSPEPPKQKPPRRITITDVLQYHTDKDTCDMCKDEERGCPRHPYERRPVSAVIDKPHYLTYLHGVPHQVDRNGRFRNGEKAKRYAIVMAGTIREAKTKLERGEVEEWLG
jgi:hypothetical protein